MSGGRYDQEILPSDSIVTRYIVCVCLPCYNLSAARKTVSWGTRRLASPPLTDFRSRSRDHLFAPDTTPMRQLSPDDLLAVIWSLSSSEASSVKENGSLFRRVYQLSL